jgi:hypothetical protein
MTVRHVRRGQPPGIDRGAFLSGDYLTVFEEIVQVKEAAGEAHLRA